MDITVKKYIEEQNLISRGDRVLCALSGGADSVAMTLILHNLSKSLGFTVFAAHFNHGIRGPEADGDQEFSRSFCDKLGIEFFSEKADIPKLSRESGKGLEECAREQRYAFLLKCAEANGINKLATAHHAQDNTETVLFHLARGAGIGGLGGISPKRSLNGITVIRPLLACSKAQIEKYLLEIGETWVTDSTNSDTEYSRNFIRAEIIPSLKRINPALDKSVLRLSEAARADEEYFLKEAEKLPKDATIDMLSRLPEPILRRYVRLLYEANRSDHGQLEYERIIDICRVIKTGGRFRMSLSGSTELICDGERLFFTRSSRDKTKLGYRIALKREGIYELPLGKAFVTESEAEFSKFKNLNQNSLSRVYSCIYNGSWEELYVRSQEPSDCYRRGGMTRCVRKELNRIKLPEHRRFEHPRFCDDDGIFWIPKLPPRDKRKENEALESKNADITKNKHIIYIGYTEN